MLGFRYQVTCLNSNDRKSSVEELQSAKYRITVACKSDVIHVKPQHIDTVKQLQIIESVYLVLLKQQNI